MRKQRGVSLIAVILGAVLLGFVALLALKLLPVYSEYFGVKSALVAIAKEQAGAPPSDIREAFYKRATIENIKSVQPDDLEITQDQTGTTISVAYQTEVSLVANISLLIKFSTSANHAAAK
ncbi:DUF4845 domain-containing protein [Chitinimonas sp.]|uniref:DUF4845 domain-containing protein n=1 Tax=Chitinimonas sp. TaxID=1934313 RepID=UPI0035B4E36C